MKMSDKDIKNLSDKIITLIGGKNNVVSITHCVTRLRFILKDKDLAKTEEIKNLKGVLGVVYGSGQYQVILGETVFAVFDYISHNYNFELADTVDEYNQEDVNLVDNLEDKKNKWTVRHIFGIVTQFLSTTLTPFITVLYGAGMLKVILGLWSWAQPTIATNSTYMLFNFMADTPFYFMPVFIAYGAAKAMKSNPAFAIALSAFLLYPNFVQLMTGKKVVELFGIAVTQTTYNSTLLPAIFGTILLAYLEKFFYKYIPGVLKAVFAPLLTLAVAMPIEVLILAPLGTIVGHWIVAFFVGLYKIAGGPVIGVFAAVWPFVIMGGMNMLFVAPMMELLSKTGYDNFFRPAWMVHNVAQGGAALAVAVRTKNEDLRSEAIAAAIGAIVSGVSEPVIYGIDLRLKKPFISVALGGLVGGTVAGIMGAKAFSMGYSSILAIPIFQKTMLAIIVGLLLSFAVSFVSGIIIGFEDIPTKSKQ